MNGQSYVNSGLKSHNGTTQTPSSNSYPASLSSQSSRDTSPSRNLNSNHYNPDKAIVPPPNIQPYKFHNDSYGNNGPENTHSIQGNNEYSTRAAVPPFSNSTGSLDQSKLPSSIKGPMNYVSPLPSVQPVQNPAAQPHSQLTGMPGVYMQNSNYGKSETEDPVYSNVGPGLTAPYSKAETFNSVPYSYQEQKIPEVDVNRGVDNLTSTVPPPKVSHFGTPQSYPQPSMYSAQPTYAPQPPKQRDQPLSSGPPRTNALGIIPYSNDNVMSTASSKSGSVSTTDSIQAAATPIYSNVSSASQSFSGAQQNYSNPSVSYSTPTNLMGYPQQQPSITTYSQQPTQYPQSSASYSTAPASSPNTYGQGYTQPSPGYAMTSPVSPYSTASSFPPPASGYQDTRSTYQQPSPLTGHYPRVSTATVSPLRPSGVQQTAPIQPPQYQQQAPPSYNQYGREDLTAQMSNLSVSQTGYNALWGHDTIDLLKTKDVLPPVKVEPPPIRLQHELYESSNCSPELFRCTLTKIPESKSLLDRSRLPLGVLIHPFKDLNQLSVVQCTVIVRCRSCRTYINPFVFFVDAKHWKCNLCFRVNELPEEFQYDPLTKTYGDPSRRPEIKSATIEFIAPHEYMVRPPQPAAYVFVLEVSRWACESGYIQVACEALLAQLEALPGDARTSVAFITYDTAIHFFSLSEGQSYPHEMIVMDSNDVFIPSPDDLLVNLSECLLLVRQLLRELPTRFKENFSCGSCLGAALQAAYKLLAPLGGRITVFSCTLSTEGPGPLTAREDPAQRSGENVNQGLLNPVTDFYKKLALDCSGQQIAVDLFVLNSQYVDLATISGISRFSGGCMHHFPLFNAKNPLMVEMFHRTLHRYLCRKIGFESVMRLRCTRGLSIHTFHGNFFVRSPDLLTLPNINPDSGFGMQVSIEESLSDIQNVCFQAALLYTSSKGERRIRVHTLCLPTASNISDILHGADQQCIIGLLAKMAVDRCHQSSLADAREAFVNVASDVLSIFKITQSSHSPSSLVAPSNLSLLPVYILALLKHAAFRTGQSTRLDDRVFAMCQMKSLPLSQLMLSVYPDLYPVHNLEEYPEISVGDDTVPQPPRIQLSSERIDFNGIYLMDDGETIMIFVGQKISPHLAKALFDEPSFASIDPNMVSLPELKTPESLRLRSFISYLQYEKPVSPVVQVIRSDSQQRQKFLERLVEDKNEAGHSYYEFLQNVKLYVK